MNQYACISGGTIIHSSRKIEVFYNDVNEKSIKVSGRTSYMDAPDDYDFPLNIKYELPYIHIRPCTDGEWNTLPREIITSDNEWDLIILDYNIDDGDGDEDEWYDEIYDTSIKHNSILYLILSEDMHIDMSYKILT